MSNLGSEPLLHLLASIDGCKTIFDVEQRLLRALQNVGVEYIFGAMATEPPTSGEAVRQAVIFNSWPQEWLKHYIDNDYIRYDPKFQHVLRHRGVAIWQEVAQRAEYADGRFVMEEAREVGLESGVTFALPSSPGLEAVVSVAGRETALHGNRLEEALFLCQFALGKVAAIMARTAFLPVALTPREIDILKWACDGKTDWEISCILGISNHTADKYMRRLRVKLNAGSRAHMVAQAFRAGVF